MAVIPDAMSLPLQAPQAAYRRPLVDDSGRLLGAAGSGFASELGDAADQSYIQDKNMARAQAANAVTDHELAVKQTLLTTQQAIADGTIPYGQAQDKFNTALQNVKAPEIANLDDIAQQSYQRSIQRNVATAQFALQGSVATARKADFQDQFGQALDKLGKLAGMPEADIGDINSKADAFRPLAIEAGLRPEIVDKALQNFKDQNWLNDATQRSMFAKQSMPALKELQSDLTSADGYYAGKLDTQKRDIVLRGVLNDQQVLQNRMEHEQDKRESKAERAVFQMNEQISSGIPAPMAMWEQLQQTVKGTSVEPDFQDLLKGEQTVQQVLREPLDQQMAYVQQRSAQLENQGGTLHDRANLMRLQTAVNQNVQLMQKQPLLFAAGRNGTDPQPMDLSTVGTPDGNAQITQTINDRMSTLSALRKQYGPQVGLAPLLPQEVGQVASQLENATPQDRAKTLTGLRDAFGNDDAYQAVMRQVAPNRPAVAIAGQMVGNSSPASTPVWFDRNLAPKLSDVQTVLQGEALLNPTSADKEKGGIKSVIPMPPEKDSQSSSGLESAYASAAGDLFRDRPQLGDAHYAVYRNAYAALSAQKGDMSGVLDTDRSNAALKIALGQTHDFNGSSVVVPPGMDPSRFEGLVHNAVAMNAQSAGAGKDWESRISGYGLREIGGLGSGRYELLNGNQVIARPDGRGPFMIDLKGQYTPGAGAVGSPADRARAAQQ